MRHFIRHTTGRQCSGRGGVYTLCVLLFDFVVDLLYKFATKSNKCNLVMTLRKLFSEFASLERIRELRRMNDSSSNTLASGIKLRLVARADRASPVSRRPTDRPTASRKDECCLLRRNQFQTGCLIEVVRCASWTEDKGFGSRSVSSAVFPSCSATLTSSLMVINLARETGVDEPYGLLDACVSPYCSETTSQDFKWDVSGTQLLPIFTSL